MESKITTEFNMKTTDKKGLVTMWFRVMIPGYECTDYYVGLSESGEWLSASGSVFDLDTDLRDKALTECRALLQKMR